MRERALLPFLLVTFAIAWAILAGYLFFNAPMSRVFGPITGQHPLFYLALYAPAIAALLVVFHGEGPGGARWPCPTMPSTILSIPGRRNRSKGSRRGYWWCVRAGSNAER
ncbi:hypothetical protein [Halomonas ventosae]|uniref:Uncharacterized protein n=1 Tax=Halomonas ventosae TaxID=229007 RepID=A0A2T0VSV7_9GAMM|nr:hypothetical protein [Halomonas ventosae]PRY73709.1 hypothetical protein BCL64_101380 [Halomonas ventosae]